MVTKKRQLKLLRRKIMAKVGENHFFYHPDDGVNGFDGEGPLVILGFRPSSNQWLPDSKSRLLLYSALIANGVGDSHLTDCIKERSLVQDDKMNFDRDWNIEVLTREFEIVRPDGIIALGNDAERFLRATGVSGACRIWTVYDFGIIHSVYHWDDSREAAAAFNSDFKRAVAAYQASKAQ
jgi:hypothetical protein